MSTFHILMTFILAAGVLIGVGAGVSERRTNLETAVEEHYIAVTRSSLRWGILEDFAFGLAVALFVAAVVLGIEAVL